MSSAKVPLRFRIYKGDELIREEVVAESVIKVGKLASSHLRIDEESVSRMHAVIEVNGPDDIQIIDLGSTRGTLVNGEKISRTRLQSNDEIQFGDVRVVFSFADDEATHVAAPPVIAAMAAQTAPPAAAPAPVAAAAPPPRPAAAPVAPPAAAPPSSYVRPPVSAPPSYAPPPSFASAAPAAPSPVAAEVEDLGARAVEVQALFRGVVINTRHLSDASGKSTGSQAKAFIGAGAAAVALAIVVFIATVFDVGHEKEQYEAHLAAGKESKNFVWKTRTPASDVLVFGGTAVGLALLYMGLKRRGKNSGSYTIGNDANADAPIGAEWIAGGSSHALVSASGADFVVNVTPQMTGEVYVDRQVMPLAQFTQQRGSSFSLPEGARAKIDAGESTFFVASTPKPRVLDVPFFVWRWSEQIYTVGSIGVLALFLLMIFSVPPDPKSLSLDLFNSDNRFVNFLIKPPEEKEEEIPEWLKKKGPDEQGGKGKRHKGEEGKMGKKTSKNKEGLYGLKGPKDNPDPHLAKKLAEENAKNAGILGVIKMNEGSHLASIFGRDTALGNDAENVLGGLIGTQIGEAYGVGGLGLVGTGSGGGGTGEGTIGLGNLGTIGKGGGGGSGSGYGRGAGGLGGRRARSPDVIPGQAQVRGSLDKEIIRRIIRRHMNEVKYCYEQELTKKPELQGRISVQFTIAATGQVVASVLQQSSMGNARVENCVVQAVRRWEFPKPLGGGIVIVAYPFVFNPAGGGE